MVGLVAARYLPVWSLVSLLAASRALQLFRTLAAPRPKEAPPGAVIVFSHNRRFGALYVLGMVLGVLLPVYV